MDDPIIHALFKAAGDFNLPADLVLALATVESSCDPRAWRHEPAYPYLWDIRAKCPFHPLAGVAASRCAPLGFTAPHFSSPLTEWIGQQSSWGLMQIMGANARAYGFVGPFPGLCEPEIGAHYGCLHLARLAARFSGDELIAAFNAGTPSRIDPRNPSSPFTNQSYVDRVNVVHAARGASQPRSPSGATGPTGAPS